MRDILIYSIVAWALAKTLMNPYLGVYTWTWISLMNPHRLAYGSAYDFPFALVIALITLVSLFIGKQAKLPVWSRETIVLLVFTLWMCVTTLFAVNPAGAMSELDRFLKIQLFIFLTVLLISDRAKLEGFVWIMVLSIGFFGVKGGIFTALTGGGARVWGPEGSFIGGNNEIALALLMTLPLMYYLQQQARRPWLVWGLRGAMLLTSVSILGSQSRGAFLGIMAIGLFFLLKSRQKALALVLVLFVAMVVAAFMPESWWDRMHTIRNYEEDASALGRINAWTVAWRMALDSITGGGANMFTTEIFLKYAPNPLDMHDVHSIYFEIMGEQGFIGLALWLSLGIMTWLRCSYINRLCKDDPTTKWAADLANMIKVSLIGYATAGAFLGLAYFDYYYDLIALTVITWRLTEAKAAVANLAVDRDAGPSHTRHGGRSRLSTSRS